MSGNRIQNILLILACVAFMCSTTPQNIRAKNVEQAADIYLNFENASLSSVVNYLAEQKKINFIPHADLAKRKVSLSTREPLTLDRSWEVLLTLLEMNGFSIINVDDVHRVVPSKTNKQEPLPLYSSQQGVSPKDLPDSDMVVRYIYILKNISTDIAGKILGDLLGSDKIKTTKELSSFIITDKCHNIKSAMKIIEELDTGGLRESIKIVKLTHAESDKVADLFTKSIFEQRSKSKRIRFLSPKQKKEITYFSSTTKIIPEKRQNALILLGLEDNINRVIDFIDKYIDIPMEKAESRIHIKELKYVKATTVGNILKDIIKPPTGKKGGPLVGEFKFFEDVSYYAERPDTGKGKNVVNKGSGNRIIVGCNKDDWKRLEKIIDKFDKPQPQVALEIMIVDIDDQNLRKLGAQIREKTGKSLGKGVHVFTTNMAIITTGEGDAAEQVTELDQNIINAAIDVDDPGSTSIAAGKPGDVWAVLKAFFRTQSTSVISQPFLVTSNNKMCTYTTRETRRLAGKLSYEKDKGYREQEDVHAATTVNITPRINLTGLVDMKIKITLSEFLSDAGNKSNRLLDTRASMATGEVLAIGGLTRDKATINKYKTPVLGDIPILGNLFKNKSQTTEKTNIYLFIRPSIIKPKFEGGPDEYTKLKLDYAKYQIFNAETLHGCKDPIERYFFRPDKQSIDEKLEDMQKNIHRGIDNYALGKYQPNSVRIERDPYFRASEEIEKVKAAEKK